MNQSQFLEYIHNNKKIISSYTSQITNYVHEFTEKIYELTYNEKTIKMGTSDVHCRAVSKGIANYETDSIYIDGDFIDIEYGECWEHEDSPWTEAMKLVFKCFNMELNVENITEQEYRGYIHSFLK